MKLKLFVLLMIILLSSCSPKLNNSVKTTYKNYNPVLKNTQKKINYYKKHKVPNNILTY